MKFYNDRVICPRCEGRGHIYEVEVVELSKRFLVCDNEDCSWEVDEELLADTWMYFMVRLEERYGVDYNSVKFQNVHYDWWNHR